LLTSRQIFRYAVPAHTVTKSTACEAVTMNMIIFDNDHIDDDDVYRARGL